VASRKVVKGIMKKLKKNPDDPKLYQQLGDAHKEQNNIDAAIEAYRKSAELYERHSKPQAAIPVYKQMLSLDPKQPEVNMKLASLFIQMDSPGDAKAQLELAIKQFESKGDGENLQRAQEMLSELTPTVWQQKVKAALSAHSSGDSARAGIFLRQAVADLTMSNKPILDAYIKFLEQAFEPAIFSDFIERAWQEGRVEDIIRIVEGLDESAHSEPIVLEAMADAHLQSGRDDVALEFYERLLARFLELGDENNAKRVALQISELDSSNAKAQAVLAGEAAPADEEFEIELEAAEAGEEVEERAPEEKIEPAEEPLPSPDELFGVDAEVEMEGKGAEPEAAEEEEEEEKVAEEEEVEIEEVEVEGESVEVAEPGPKPEEVAEEAPAEAAAVSVDEGAEAIGEALPEEGGIGVEELVEGVEEVAEVAAEMEAESVPPEVEVEEAVEETQVEFVELPEAEEAPAEEAVVEEERAEPVAEEVSESEVEPEPAEAPEEVPEEVPEAEFEALVKEVEQSDPRRAVSVVEDYVRRHPSDVVWQQRLAELYVRTDDVERAKSKLEDCAHLARSAGLQDREIECWNQYLNIEPWGERAHLRLKEIYRESDPPKAVKHLEALAAIAVEDGRSEQAADFYEEMVEIDPKNSEAYRQLKKIYVAQGRKPEALSVLQKLVDLELEQDDINEAESYLREIIEIDPLDKEARRKLFNIAKRKGELELIDAELVELVNAEENSGNLQSAVELLEEGISLGLPEEPIRVRLKRVYSALDRMDKAVEQLYLLADMAQSVGSLDDAIAYLEEVLRIEPQDLEARERIKKLYAQREEAGPEKRELFVLIDVARSKGDKIRLERYLKELVERDPANDSAKLELADLYADTGRIDEAKRMLFDMADEKLRAGDFTSGEKTFHKILKLDATDEQAKRGLIGIYLDRDQRRGAADLLWEVAKAKIEEEDLEGAKTVLKEVMQIWPDHEEGLRAQIDIALRQELNDEAISRMLELSELYQREGKFDEAVEVLEKAVELGPDCEPAYQRLAQIHQYVGRTQQAYEVLMRFSDWLRQTGQLQRAVEVLTDILKAAPDHEQARLSRKGIYLNLGNRQKAIADLFVLADQLEGEPERQKQFLEEIIGLEPSNSVARERLVALLKEQGNVGDAVEHLRFFLKEAMERERFSEVLDRARQILEYEPDNPENRRVLAEAYRKLGDRQRAVEELMAAAQMYLDREEADQAEQLLRAAVEEDPGASGARLMLSELYRRQGDEEKASQEMHRLADHLASLGMLNEAQKILRTTLKYNPGDELALRKLADFERKLGKKEEAIEILFDLASRSKDAGRLDEAEEYYSQVLRVEPLNVNAQSELAGVLVEKGEKERAAENLLMLSSRLSLSGKLDEAEAQLDKVLEFLPNHQRALYFKAELAHKRGDVDGAVENLCSAANAAAEGGDLLKAQKLLKQALKLAPLSLESHDRLVELYLEGGRTGAAVSELTQFARNLLREERFSEARSKLERASELDPSNRIVLVTLKDLALRRDDTESAVELLLKLAETARDQKLSEEEGLALKEVLSLDEENAQAHNMLVDKYLRDGQKDMALAEIYRLAELKVQSGVTDDAISLYKRACTVDPDAEMPHHKLLELFLKQGRTKEAVGEHMALSEIAFKKGHTEKELESLKNVMSLDPLNVEAHTRLKERYMELGRKEDAAEELSTFAEALKRENKVVEAIDAYEELLQLLPGDAELLMTLARLLLEADRRQQAISRFEEAAEIAHGRAMNELAEEAFKELLNLDPGRTKERETLAELLASLGRLKEAAQELQILAEQLKDLGDFDQAVVKLKRIVELIPDHIAAHELLKQVYLDQGNTLDAQAELESLVRLSWEKGDQKAAMGYLDELLRIAPESESAYILAANIHRDRGQKSELIADLVKLDQILLDAGKLEKSLEYLKEAVGLEPENKELLERFTERAVRLNRYDDAIESLLKLAELEADNPSKCCEYLRRTIDIDPRRSDVRKMLAATYEQAGEKREAISEYFVLADEAAEDGDKDSLKSLLESIVSIAMSNMEARWKLADIHIEEGEIDKAVDQLFGLVDIAIESGRRRLAEMFLREIFTHDPQNNKAKDKLTDLFLKFAEVREDTEKLALEAERALHKGDLGKAYELVGQLSRLEPDNLTLKEKLEELGYRLRRGAPEEEVVEETAEEEGIEIDWAEDGSGKGAESVEGVHITIDHLALLEEAEQFIRGGFFEEARKKLEKVVQSAEYGPRAKVYMALALHREGDSDGARSYLSEIDVDGLPDKERDLAAALKGKLEG